MSELDDVIDWDAAPDGLDRIAADLRALRSAAGEPSYTDIGARVSRHRAARGVPEHERVLPRTTLYNCFRDGRRRIDADTVTEIALALGLPERLRSRWSARVRLARAAASDAATALRREQTSAPVTARETAPEPVPTFGGRTGALATIAGVLRERGAVWVSGMAGAGKTQLALKAVRREPAGAFFVDLRGFRAESPTVEVAAAQHAILRLLGENGADASDDEDRARRIARALHAEKRHLVLDDAPGDGTVRRIVGDDPPAGVIVTSRALPDTDGWRHLALGGLEGAETAQVLTAFAEREVREDDVERLTTITDGLPLAIALVGGRMRSHPTWVLAEHIGLLERRLTRGHIDHDLEGTLGTSYEDLPEEARRLLRALSDLPVAELDGAAIAALLDVDEPSARSLSAILVRASLAIPRGGSRLALHALVRAFARERAESTDSPRARDAAFVRLGRHYADRVWAAYETLASSDGDVPRRSAFRWRTREDSRDEAEGWLRDNVAAVLAVAHAAPAHGEPALLLRISEGISWWMALSGRHEEGIRLHRAAIWTAAEIGDADGLVMASLDIAQLLLNGERPEEARAHLERAARAGGDGAGLSDPGLPGVIRNMLAVAHIRHGLYEEAVDALRLAVAIHERRHEAARLLSALVNLGFALHRLGRIAEARRVVERGLELADEEDRPMWHAHFTVNLAGLLIAEGDHAAAIDAAERAVALASRIGFLHLVAHGHGAVAEAALHAGNLDTARAHITSGIAVAREIGEEATLANVLIVGAALGVVEADADAARMLAEAEALLTSDGDQVLRGRLWWVRAEAQRDPHARREWWHRALTELESVHAFEAARLRARMLDAGDAVSTCKA